MTLKSIQTAAMRLPAQERSRLAAALLSSLESDDPSELETMWIEEADRRYRAYRTGRDKSIPAKEAIASVRESLKR